MKIASGDVYERSGSEAAKFRFGSGLAEARWESAGRWTGTGVFVGGAGMSVSMGVLDLIFCEILCQRMGCCCVCTGD